MLSQFVIEPVGNQRRERHQHADVRHGLRRRESRHRRRRLAAEHRQRAADYIMAGRAQAGGRGVVGGVARTRIKTWRCDLRR